jgi:hypothetical protein
LENHEPISRYGFSELALVELKTSKAVPDYSIKVTLPDGTFTVLQVNPVKLYGLTGKSGKTVRFNR